MSTDPDSVITALRTTTRDLLSLTTGAPEAALRRRPAPREWSAAQVVAHLADAEMVYGVRMRITLTEDLPTHAAYDENAWADRFGDLDEDVRDSLSRWRALRASNVKVLASLSAEDWSRSGIHQERGRETVADIAERMVGHDRNHLDQIRKLLS